MAEKRSIKATDIVRDIRAGMSDVELMNKYKLSSKGLQSAYKKLASAQAVSPSELCLRSFMYDDTVTIDDMRKLVRNPVPMPTPIYDRGDLTVRGLVHDITERGVGIRGMPAHAGERKTLLVTPDELVEVDPFEFEALCRWAESGGDEGPLSGWEITAISEKALREIRKIIRLLTTHDPSLLTLR